MKTKKGNLSLLYEFILFIAVAILMVVLVFQVTGDVKSDLADQETVTATCNSTSGIYSGCTGTGITGVNDSETALAKVPKSFKILATAITFAVIIYVVLRIIPMGSFGGGRAGGF